MSRSARSLAAFAAYLVVTGAVLLTIPNVLLSLLALPETHEVWIRVVGMLALILAYYYSIAARRELVDLIRGSVWARGSVILFFGAFVALGLAPPILLGFGVVDLAAALWTARCLQSEDQWAA